MMIIQLSRIWLVKEFLFGTIIVICIITLKYNIHYILLSPPYYRIFIFLVNWYKSFVTMSPLFVHAKLLITLYMCTKHIFSIQIHDMITYYFFLRWKRFVT